LSKKETFDGILKIATSFLSLFSLFSVAAALGTNLGQNRDFVFVISGVAMVAAIGFAFQAVRGLSKFARVGCACQILVSLICLAVATQLP
jgi:hypothetical protein